MPKAKEARKVILKVSAIVHKDITEREFKEYIRDAVHTMGGSYHPDDYFFDPDWRKSIKVTVLQ